MTNSRSSCFSRVQLSTDFLWPLILLAGFGFYASLLPLPPNDFWWHLKIGELIATQGSIPAASLFTWAIPPDTPYVYGAWLSEWLFFLLYRTGGLALVIFARNLIFLAAFWLVGYHARLRSGSWRLAALAVALACAMTMNNLPVRPQIWSWLPFLVFLILLERYTAGALKPAWLLVLPGVMVFWVNAHGAFILGGVLLGIIFVGEALQTLLKQPGANPYPRVAWIGVVGMLTGLAMFINPLGLDIVAYVKDLMTDPPSQQYIVEWQSPTPNGIANIAFYLSIMILLVSWIYSRYRPRLTELLLLAGFLWLAWSGQRYVIWYGMIAMPLLARIFHELPLRVPDLTPPRNWVNTLLALLLFLPVALAQPWFVERFPLPERYWRLVQRGAPQGPLIGVETPLGAVEYLRAHPGGDVFNEMGYGSYLIWALPEQKVFIDPRVELYPLEMWDDYLRITRGARHTEILDRYGAERILLDREYQPELASALEQDPGWRLEYEDNRSQIWKRVK